MKSFTAGVVEKFWNILNFFQKKMLKFQTFIVFKNFSPIFIVNSPYENCQDLLDIL